MIPTRNFDSANAGGAKKRLMGKPMVGLSLIRASWNKLMRAHVVGNDDGFA